MTHEYVSALANHLWQSTLFAGVAALLTLALRRNHAAARYSLWMAASVKFLIPFALLVRAGSLIPWHAAVPVTLAGFVSVPTQVGIAIVPTVQPQVQKSVELLESVAIILLAVWLCGAAAVVVAWFREWRRVRNIMRAASPLRLSIPIAALSTSQRVEPGVIGVFRQVLLLPEGLTERLTKEQFDAVLGHEMCHVRRRDNLAALIHMVVEALFWFHPLVWWIERRLIDERERACDEDVLRAGGDPQTYAEGILNVCKFYRETPLVCMSGVTGSNLKNRIEVIMSNRIVQKLGVARTTLLTAAAAAVLVVPIAFGMARVSQKPVQKSSQAAESRRGLLTGLLNDPKKEEGQETSSSAWLDGIEAEGLRNLSVDDVIRLKGIGVDAAYIRALRSAGFELNVEDLVRFRGIGITPDFVQAIKATGIRDLNAENLIRLKGIDISPEYIKKAQKRFKDITVEDLIRLKGIGIDL
jgi:beta-lactamase regulating signal transducer with metallopeptidase domain